MNVLITGAGGFIGRHLVFSQLQRGRQVTAVDLNIAALASVADEPRLRILQGNFADRDLVDRFLPHQDVCFHLAAAHLETSRNDEYFWRVNMTDTLDFAIRCHQAGVERFVHCSSVGVYGPLKNLPADEDTPCQPSISYEKSKLAGEQNLIAYARETGFEVVVIRPAWVYGPGCRRTARLFRSIQKNRFFFVGNGQTMRHPVYVADVIQGFEVAATNPFAPGEIFIFAGPEAITLIDLTTNIAKCIEVPPPRIRLPFSLVWMGCLILEGMERITGKEMPFSRRSLKFFTDSSAFTAEKARKLLGFEAGTTLSAGLNETFTWITSELEGA